MKEIKFRQWLGNKFHYFDLDIHKVDRYDVRNDINQYTGIKDKNGKNEIYEGDILNRAKPYEVIFLNGRFAYGRDNRYYHFDKLIDEDSFNTLFKFEVIGNIYENPEIKI